jgi:hypothetical protein
MEKNNLFFTYLDKLHLHKEKLKKDENNKEERADIRDETTKVENEWLQEYEVIYKSYSIG